MKIRASIIELMESKKYKPLLKEEILVKFNIERKDRQKFYEVLDGLEKEGLIIKTPNDRYALIKSEYLVVGVLEGHERGFGFVVSSDKTREDVFIPSENMGGAIHGDRVIANITKRSEVGKREEGEIIRILERGNKFLVGTFEDNKSFGFFIPDNQKIFYDVFIAKSNTGGAKHNQKVVIEIVKWPEARRNPEGKVVEILGFLGEKGTDVLSIIRQFELPEKFPPTVQEEANSIEISVSMEEMEGRLDLREAKTFTIDGVDAKDLDDAISIAKLENGNYELGVHIADVSYYVKEKSPLDKEAYKRGNSVYLIDRVIPMLPKELSNGICSLNPNVDRLTLSIIMEINNTGDVVKHKIVESVINSKHRLVYDDVSDYLENDDNEAKEKLKDILDELKLMKELMDILYEGRVRRGSIDFNFPETKIVLDENGIPVEIGRLERRIANRIIEEFMLVSNETVAEEYFWAELPFLYRIHEEPSQEKLQQFAEFIHNLGYNLKGKQEIHPKELQLLIEDIKGKKEEIVISTLLLRSLRKAIYSSTPDIHFGLAAKYYSHFTAPIRRYPDLVIHRIIKENIKGKLSGKRRVVLEDTLPEIAEYTSKTERRAEEAEREVEDLKKTQYMSKRIGNTYEGIVSSLTSFGIFIQLENTIEGLVHFGNMVDDYYRFDEEKYHIIGERTGKVYKLGDVVKIKVVGANVASRKIDFELIP